MLSMVSSAAYTTGRGIYNLLTAHAAVPAQTTGTCFYGLAHDAGNDGEAAPTYTALTSYNLGSTAAAAYGNCRTYAIFDANYTDGQLDYPASTLSSTGHLTWSVINRTLSHSNDVNNTLNDALYFFRFTQVPAITGSTDYAELEFSIESINTIFETPIYKIRGLKTAPTWPTSGVGGPEPIGYGNYTTAAVYWRPLGDGTGTVNIDVTDIINELVGTAGAGAGVLTFVFETVDPIEDYNGVGTNRAVQLTAFATTQPKFKISSAISRVGYMKRTPVGAVIRHFIPMDSADLGAAAASVTSLRTIVNGNSTVMRPVSPFIATYSPDDYSINTTGAPSELEYNDLRQLFGNYSESDIEFYNRVNFGLNDQLIVYQYVQTAVNGGKWLFDVHGNDSAPVIEILDNSANGFGHRATAPNNTVATDYTYPGFPYIDSVGAVKTLVAFYDNVNNGWIFGYHDSSQWNWTSLVSQNSPNVTVPFSGFYFPPGKLQGLLYLELTTERSQAEIKEICGDIRDLWRAGKKWLPASLY